MGIGHRAQPDADTSDPSASEADVTVANGELAIECPTCPQPGVNLPDDWKNDPDQ